MTEIRTNYCVACKEMADRIEELETQNEGYKLALAEQLQIRQELESWKAAEEAHHHMLRAEAAENARIVGMSAEREMALRGEIERLRKALEWYVAEDEKYIRAALGGETK